MQPSQHVVETSQHNNILAKSLQQLSWTSAQPAPGEMSSRFGSTVLHKGAAYFPNKDSIYTYTFAQDTWKELKVAFLKDFGLAVVKNVLTTVGGLDMNTKQEVNSLFSYVGNNLWKEMLPPMPTEKAHPATANTRSHLLVAGGHLSARCLEVLDTKTLQWFVAEPLPNLTACSHIKLCDGFFYVSYTKAVFHCSVKELLESCQHPSIHGNNQESSVWTRLADIPAPYFSTLESLEGRLLAIGGDYSTFSGQPTGTIHCYDVATNSWSVIGEMPTPRGAALTAVLPNDTLLVVGGKSMNYKTCSVAEIGHF